MVTRLENMNDERGYLMVSTIENERICSRVEQLTLSGDEYEELFNEGIKGNNQPDQPVHFYQ